MTFRTVVKEVAIEQGVYATFMPKPLSGHPGSRHAHAHVAVRGRHERVLRGRRAVPAVEDSAASSSPACSSTRPEITAVTNQFVNSYKRLWGGDEAPSFVCWGHNNRSALIRVPLYKPSKGQSSRVEYRAIDSAANPYLAFSLMLAAGLKGIEGDYELPAEAEDNVWSLSDAERRALGLQPAAGQPRPRRVDHGGLRTGRRDAR